MGKHPRRTPCCLDKLLQAWITGFRPLRSDFNNSYFGIPYIYPDILFGSNRKALGEGMRIPFQALIWCHLSELLISDFTLVQLVQWHGDIWIHPQGAVLLVRDPDADQFCWTHSAPTSSLGRCRDEVGTQILHQKGNSEASSLFLKMYVVVRLGTINCIS